MGTRKLILLKAKLLKFQFEFEHSLLIAILYLGIQCDKLCGEGKRNRKVTCHRKTDGRVEKLEDSDCEDPLPARTESCFLRPCEGVDWIVSDWLGVSVKMEILI